MLIAQKTGANRFQIKKDSVIINNQPLNAVRIQIITL